MKKVNILAQAVAHIGTYVELASCPRLSVSILNTNVKNLKEGMSSVDLPPSSINHWNVHHWRNLDLHLVHGTSKHLD
jgi:hypothetical protein